MCLFERAERLCNIKGNILKCDLLLHAFLMFTYHISKDEVKSDMQIFYAAFYDSTVGSLHYSSIFHTLKKNFIIKIVIFFSKIN